MGLGPHPTHRPSHRDDAERGRILFSDPDARARARTRNRERRTRFRPLSAECSRARGWPAFALHRPPFLGRAYKPAWEPLAAGEDRERPAYVRRAGRRPPMELFPDSIRSSTSCRAIAARPAKNRRRMPRAAEATPRRSDSALRARSFAKETLVKATGSRSPRSTHFRGPPTDFRPREQVGQQDRSRSGHAFSRAARARPARLAVQAARATCRQGFRAASPKAPRRARGSADTRGAFRRWAAYVNSPGLSSRVIYLGRVFSTVCRQPVESTRRPFRLRRYRQH
jgi:hypothetical protein